MLMRFLKVIALGFILAVTADYSANAAVYSLFLSLPYPPGESVYTFNGTFDSSLANSGSGILSYEPIEAEDPPYTEKLSGLDFVLSTTVMDGVPLAEVSVDNFFLPVPNFPIYFDITDTGFSYDPFYSPLFGSGALALVPLPSTVGLFGVALLILGFACGLKRRTAPAFQARG